MLTLLILIQQQKCTQTIVTATTRTSLGPIIFSKKKKTIIITI